ncbi:hypothetical protein SL003B_1221 [Polymorphum gilvum SL003B-26A1]|uniref:Uncharacterized protein n=1 Tax=Polymorphum gilvum (strain LMG 25793 / CGMCC 1.9160 / SL003B-26A1) TaxID=991905 RepID=F2J0I2_POLGS|nr:hypothetical protein SL003B_1221 [Polymorphum gilvum SL003B-26A1]
MVLSGVKKRFSFGRGLAETALVAALFYGYGSPAFDAMRPDFLDAPLTQYREAIHDLKDGRTGVKDGQIVAFSASFQRFRHEGFSHFRLPNAR